MHSIFGLTKLYTDDYVKKKNPGDCNIKTGGNLYCQTKMCYISIDIQEYMFKYIQNN